MSLAYVFPQVIIIIFLLDNYSQTLALAFLDFGFWILNFSTHLTYLPPSP
jgi:hypothetical protein